MTEVLRYMVADDSYLQREGLISLLRPRTELELVGVAHNGREAVELAQRIAPNVVLTDIVMPEMDGITAAREIRRLCPGVGVVVLSKYDDEQYVVDLMRDGTSGLAYLLWESVADVRELVAAIRQVARGGTVLDPRIIEVLAARGTRGPSALSSLSSREQEVLQLVSQGLSNTAIAQRLHISASAVEKHISAIFATLNLDPDDSVHHRRVLAVLECLRAAHAPPRKA